MVKVRFAPSPTGHLHIGGARTALFNRLFAKKAKGVFLLRIEDTDELRSTDESVKTIFESMKWLGLDWDEGAFAGGEQKGDLGPYFQAERAAKGVYKPYAEKLVSQKKAYRCYCTPQELDVMRRKAQAEKRPPYDGRCRNLTQSQISEFKSQGRKPVIRFRMPDDGTTAFHDLIHGDLSFKNSLLYDFIIVKALGYPTYNFACVIDDHLMEISHVIRGDDHISNTPLQWNVYSAFGWEPPEFAHLPMILGADGTRLSKRHGAASVWHYRESGYLPQALGNYLALLGWSTPDSQQIFTKGELENKFNLDGCQKSPAIFDPVKLLWMNGEYIRQLSGRELLENAMPFLKKADVGVGQTPERLMKIVTLEQEKYKLLGDIPRMVDFFFSETEFDAGAVEEIFKSGEASAPAVLSGMKERYGKMTVFTESALESETRSFARENGLKAGQVFHPLRVAVSGRMKGPTLFKMLEYMGRETVIRRIEKALDKWGHNTMFPHKS